MLRKFSEDSSFHGLKQIFEEPNICIRRCMWIVLLVGVTSVFLFLISTKLHYYYQRPSLVDISRGYEDAIPFPKVTICNQNPYRMTAIHQLGLYDVVTEAYNRAKGSATADPEDCTDRYEMYTSVCAVPESAATKYIIKETTCTVCKHLCTTVEGSTCSGVLYDPDTRTCTLTSFTGEDHQGVVLPTEGRCNDTIRKFYRRHRCLNGMQTYCDFEEPCSWQQDPDASDIWITKQGPDHTITLVSGHYMQMLETDKRPGYYASTITSFMDTTSQCLVFFYKFGGSSVSSTISIISRGEDMTETILKQINRPTIREWSRGWLGTKLQLANGINQLIIRGQRATDGASGILLDDVRIVSCISLRQQECRTSLTGTEYLGIQNQSQSGRPCLPWLYTIPYRPETVKFVETAEESANYCRNPDGDMAGPWCYTDLGRREPCNIPFCDCTDDWFRCRTGNCIPQSMVCDGKVDCMDSSDETTVCVKALVVQMDGVTPGDQVDVESPPQNLTMATTLSFYAEVRVEPDDILTKLEIYLQRPSGERIIKLMEIAGSSQRRGLIRYQMCIPEGRYSISFVAVLGMTSLPYIVVDEVELAKPCIPNEVYTADPEGEAISCDFDAGLCGYQFRSESTLLRWDRVSADVITANSLISTFGADCYGEFYSVDGWIVSPGYPDWYPDDIFCTYYIKQPEHATIIIDFDKITMEYEPSCGHDWLEIRWKHTNKYTLRNTDRSKFGPNDVHYDSTNQSSSIDGKQLNYDGYNLYCGHVTPNSLLIRGSVVALSFYANDVIHDRGFSIKYHATSVPGHDYALALSFRGPYHTHQYTSSLLSPIVTVIGPHCLVFDFTAFHELQVFQTDDRHASRMLLHVLAPTGWHWMRMRLDIGEDKPDNERYPLGIIFRSVVDFENYRPTYLSAINNIKLLPGRCDQIGGGMSNEAVQRPYYVSVVSTSVNCDFNTIDQCGYRDTSDGAIRWMRTCAMVNDSVQPSDWVDLQDCVMTVRFGEVSHNVPVMRSPRLNGKLASCVHFKAKKAFDNVELIVRPYNEDKAYDEFAMVFHSGMIANQWKWYSINLPTSGHFRLEFQATGVNSVLYLDEVKVVYSGCQSSGDPLDSQEQDNVRRQEDDDIINEEEKERPSKILKTTDEYNKDSLRELIQQQVLVLSLASGRRSSSVHLYNAFPFSCTWNGKPCSSNATGEIFTDMHRCWTFNGNTNDPLKATFTGTQMGLKLTINIEQYEHIEGISIDSGVKVLLHSQDDEPLVNDMGFAVGPGMHSLASLSYGLEHFLEAPYGGCGVRPLTYFHNVTYTYSRCKRECDIRMLETRCRCTDAYMNGLDRLPCSC
ncbi:hypothetical protein LSH36_5g02006 [Paralvinella palmiformis]|uniref:Uncharacterized protein n=1 Tax=Paralvinella palmiformis TaxID=53620 RepID=A0AAD9KEU6_9ANNE|nr:hypothetical protein LSH36_5g02006 [Paralvinella palmiformis]